MRWERDLGADCLYVYVADVPIDHTEELSDGTIVDVGPGGELVGVEILAASSGWAVTALADRFALADFDQLALRAISHPPVVGLDEQPDKSSVGSSAINVAPQHV